ncbi:MAG: NACHT domain-containing protein [Bacteroidota bacterium]
MVTYIFGAIVIIFFRNEVIAYFIYAIDKVYGLEFSHPGNGIIAYYLILILVYLGALYANISGVHQNWNGLKSIRQVDHKEIGKKISVWQDIQYYWKYRDDIEIYHEKKKAIPEVFSEFEPDTRPWHTKAADLLRLIDQQYKIKSKEWYNEYKCYLSRYGQDNEGLSILCLEKTPTPDRVEGFINFIRTRSNQFVRLIVAIKGKGKRGFEHHNGFTVEFRYESEMLDNLIQLSGYLDYITDYFEEHESESNEPSLAEMYVPLAGQTVAIEKGKLKKDQPIDAVETYILEWAKGKRTHPTEHLALLGDYGQGKTVLTHKIVKEMLNNPVEYNRIPILIELRGMSPRNDDEFSIFGRWAQLFQAKAEALWELHRAGKLLVILDGFDEMDLVGDTHLLFNHFTQLWNLARVPNSQILIAGRPNLFADDEERRAALGILPPRIDLPYAQAVYLEKLTAPQIEQVLRNAQPTTKQGILNALEISPANSSFAELVTRPSTLYQLSTVWDSELARQKERLNSATVIGSFLKKAYDRQQRKRATVLTATERHYFLMGIAVGMMLEGAYSNQIRSKDLNRWIAKLWESYPKSLPPYEDAMQGNQASDPLPDRLRENADALATIIKDVRVGGVLVQDLSGRDVFKFAHKSYMEYLVSAFFSGLVLQSEHDRPLLMMVNAIAKATNFSQSKLKGTPDVERFTAELIAAQVELSDEKGNPLPIEENKEAYSKELYKMLILSSYPIRGRLSPNLTAWLSLHPDQNQFVAIGLLAILGAVLFYFVDDGSYEVVVYIFNILLCIWWMGIVIKYRINRSSLERFKRSDYMLKARLYQNSCLLIGCQIWRLSSHVRQVLHHNENLISGQYDGIIKAVLVYSILVSGAFMMTVFNVVTGFSSSFTSLVILTILVAIFLTDPGPARIGITGAISITLAVSIIIAIEFAGMSISELILPVIAILLFLLLGSYLIYLTYEQFYKDEIKSMTADSATTNSEVTSTK